MDSPIGDLLLAGGDGGALQRLHMLDGRKHFAAPRDWRRDDDGFAEVRDQLREYFAGERHTFAARLDLRGTDFQVAVWHALLEIPYGETASYGEIARRIGRPDTVRAVGTTNGRNPIAVIIPCHRVIGADGSLVGYGGGLDRKRLLLELEAEHSAPRLWPVRA